MAIGRLLDPAVPFGEAKRVDLKICIREADRHREVDAAEQGVEVLLVELDIVGVEPGEGRRPTIHGDRHKGLDPMARGVGPDPVDAGERVDRIAEVIAGDKATVADIDGHPPDFDPAFRVPAEQPVHVYGDIALQKLRRIDDGSAERRLGIVEIGPRIL